MSQFKATNKLRLSQLICDQLEWLSDDSDDGRDNKYNILDETDMIEEEDECNEDDDDNEYANAGDSEFATGGHDHHNI